MQTLRQAHHDRFRLTTNGSSSTRTVASWLPVAGQAHLPKSSAIPFQSRSSWACRRIPDIGCS